MDKRYVAGTVVGGAVLWATGWLIFNKLFAAFYTANQGSATGVDRAEPILWAIVLANLAYGALITLVIMYRGATSLVQGALTGATVGFLAWLHVDLVLYGSANIANLTRTLVDPVLEFVHGGLGGAAIAFTLSKIGAPEAG